jgi:hypothetical protein
MGHPALAGDENLSLSRRERRAVTLTAFATREDGSIVDVTITDVSYDGCGVICDESLSAGEQLKISVVRRGVAVATVRWVDGSRAGLTFASEPVDETSARQPRRHERISVSGEVSMRRAGRANFKVHVYDLSPDGCKAEFVDRPDLHEQLWIRFEGIEALEANVRWIAGAKTGLKFSRAIHPAVFDLLTARLGRA